MLSIEDAKGKKEGRPSIGVKYSDEKEIVPIAKRGIFRDFKKKMKEFFANYEKEFKSSRKCNREPFDPCGFCSTLMLFVPDLPKQAREKLVKFAEHCFDCPSKEYLK